MLYHGFVAQLMLVNVSKTSVIVMPLRALRLPLVRFCSNNASFRVVLGAPLFASFCFSARFALSLFMFLNVFVCLCFAAKLRMIT